MVYRALRKAKDAIIGKHEDGFKKLYQYANEVKKVMPTSIVKLMTEAAEFDFEGRRFKRFYVCLGPLKEGFLHGCRPLIGLDGCHLKGPFKGILLTAVGTDPNEGMYPIAWAQVEAENTSSWYWFLGQLKQDLMIQNSGTYTFISDRQKGLINALESHIPESEHRLCVMHLYNNMKSISKGLGISKTMWQAVRSTTYYFFNMNMETIKKLSKTCYDWLIAKPKSQWSRASFRDVCKSDVFVNNNCESFNNAIKKYRDNGIVTMFNNIYKTCMQRIQKRAIKLAGKATLVWNGGDKYHVTMSAGGHEKMDPLDFIHQCYSKETYMEVYSHILEPISGEAYWEQTEQDEPLPPLKRTPPGRPKKFRDKRNDVVPTRANNPTMLKRQGTTLRCSHCGQWEHNVRSCPRRQAEEAQGEGELTGNLKILSVLIA
ncbi:uncharacterized protein LOC141691065 [Apium graveolens]|uniref:uncharacterized protein LOC141691065 n=1 Tax=Apium graveolens TaxID=4045 RepID=UPI003D7AB2D1